MNYEQFIIKYSSKENKIKLTSAGSPIEQESVLMHTVEWRSTINEELRKKLRT